MKFRFEVGILGMLLMTQYFLVEKIIQNMQTEFTSINFDNEDVDPIKVDCVAPQMIRTPGQNRDRSELQRFMCSGRNYFCRP